jgi:hypothetical protein
MTRIHRQKQWQPNNDLCSGNFLLGTIENSWRQSKIEYEKKEIVVKHNFNNSGAIVLKIKHTLLLQIGTSQIFLNICYISFIYTKKKTPHL